MGKMKELLEGVRGIWSDTGDVSGINGTISNTGGASGTFSITNGTNTFNSIQFPDPLSKEEAEELKMLRDQSFAEIKAIRINMFKKLPKEIRQHVINSEMWQEAVRDMNNTTSPSRDRIVELELRQMRGGNMFNNSYHSNFYGAGLSNLSNIGNLRVSTPMPDGLNIKDLTAAHLEACVEEELIDGV